MQILTYLAIMLPPLLVAIYTWNYARWAWGQDLRRGAVGLWFLAAAALAAPAFALWWNS